MIYSRNVGRAKIYNILEYSGPTHAADFVFPELDVKEIKPHLSWLAPHHYNIRLERFIVAMQLWVMHIDDKVIVIDLGVGNHKKRASERMNNLNTLTPLWLAAAGADPKSVTHVIVTHFHPDHVGWGTRMDNGQWVPMFPNARHLMPKVDFENAHAAYLKGDKGVISGSFEDSVLPLYEAGLIDLIGDGDVVAGCLEAEAMPGHTPGSLHFRLQSEGKEAIFAGDVMHSPLQIAMPHINTWIDAHAEQARTSRALFLKRAAERNALIMPVHFGWPHCGYVRGDSVKGYRFEPAEPDARGE
jgi:glyoxylase-like metal-dependent hydrolase (beta-lactamase superfamily II)